MRTVICALMLGVNIKARGYQQMKRALLEMAL